MTGKGSIAWMARNPVAANLIMLLLLGGGLWTATYIQQEVEPEFVLDVVRVSVGYPGSSPAEVEKGILMPIEEAVRGVRGIRETRSTAREGFGSVSIELVAGTDRMRAYQDIDQAISRIRTFPDDIEQPEVRLEVDRRRVMTLGVYGDVDPWSLRQLAEQLRDQLVAHPGITQVEMGRVADYVVHVEIPQKRLRAHGLTIGQVARIIGDSSSDVPAGTVDTRQGAVLVRVKERKQWAEEFAKIPIISARSGSPLTLGELAEITDGFEEKAFHSLFNRTPTVGLQVYRVGDESPLDVASAVEEVIADFETTLPDGVKLRVDASASDDYEDRLDLLIENALLATLIVVVILALFLELRLAFWVMMGMVISFVGGIALLPLFDVSINMISMFGFLVVLGIVVDDAVVVGENIYEHSRSNPNRLEAAIAGAQEIAKPVTFSILTNIVAFVPLFFIPGSTGKYWWPMPAVVIVVLAVSLFEALYILPAHLGHMRSGPGVFGDSLSRLQKRFARGFDAFVARTYGPLLARCLRYRYVTISAAVAILLVIGGYGYSGHMGMIMMPEVAADEIEAGVRLPVGTTPDKAARIAMDITDSTLRMFEEHDLDRVAEGVKTNLRRGGRFVDVEIVMKPPDERDMTANDVIRLWRDQIGDIDGVHQISFEAERGPGGHRQDISIDLSHDDIDVLERATHRFVERLESLEEARDIGDNFNKGTSQLDLEVLPAAAALGLDPDTVGAQVRDAFFGALALRQLRGTNEIEVRVKLPVHEREDLQTLEDFVIRAPSGTEVPVAELVKISRSEAFSTLNRRNGRRAVTVSMDIDPKSAISRVLAELKATDLPALRAEFPGLTWSFHGTQAEMRESTRMLWGGFALALGVIFSLLAIAFRNYHQPVIVLAAIPFGVVGAIIGHLLLGFELSLVSLMGIVALSGVVVNDSLIMIDYANRKRAGEGAFEAIYSAGLRRFRPILLTTLTTFGGLSPIIFETSNQAKHLIPMAISLGFGILFSTAIILLLVPCLYLAADDVTKA